MIRIAALFIVIVMSAFLPSVLAQHASFKGSPQSENDLNYFRLCNSMFVSVPLQVKNNYREATTQYLKEAIGNLLPADVGLDLIYEKESPGGKHLSFEQTFHGMPVFDSRIKVNIDKQNRIKSVYENSWNTSKWSAPALANDLNRIDLEFIKNHMIEQRGLHDSHIKIREVIVVIDEKPIGVAEVIFHDLKSGEMLLLLSDSELNISGQRDLKAYHIRTTATGLVFIPDPLTSAGVYYGPPYVDSSNADVAVLNAQRKLVDLEVTFDGGVYKLENQYVIISDFSPPNVPPAVSTMPAFHFTRAQPGFEDVNAFYHLTNYCQYVESLEFGDLVSGRITADAHGEDGRDQSVFTPGFNGGMLSFGDGGVADAEDADVIVHELGHALSQSASPFSNSGHWRRSIDEGLGDYFATSYSREINEFRWADMFTWDGHNEYWVGRTATTPKVYPADRSMTSIHANGEIYNAALMKIWESIGREKTDKLVLQSLYYLEANMGMKEAAMTLYEADTALYGGAHFCEIYRELVRKGLSDTFNINVCRKLDQSIMVDAGSDITICNNTQTVIGNDVYYNSNYTYIWSPLSGLGSPFTVTTPAYPAMTTIYTVEARMVDGSFNVDTIIVQVLGCDILVDAGSDRFICAGDSVLIGNPDLYRDDYSYTWMPVLGLSSPQNLVTYVTPSVTTVFMLKAELEDGSYNIDTVTVHVLACDDIELLNTNGFRFGQDLVISLPQISENNVIEMFDVGGKRIFQDTQLSGQVYTLNGRLFAPGVYILRIRTPDKKLTRKIVKVSER